MWDILKKAYKVGIYNITITCSWLWTSDNAEVVTSVNFKYSDMAIKISKIHVFRIQKICTTWKIIN